MEDPDTEVGRISEDFRALQCEAQLEKVQVKSVPIRRRMRQLTAARCQRQWATVSCSSTMELQSLVTSAVR